MQLIRDSARTKSLRLLFRLFLIFVIEAATTAPRIASAAEVASITVFTGTADKISDSMEGRVQACIGCHGPQGRGVDDVYFPRLAGKPAGYLYNQLIAFRNGTRKYAPMNYLLAYLPDPYLQKMADYFATQNVPAPAPVRQVASAAILAMGHDIIYNGLPAQRIPACVACHGAALGGRQPGIPGLLGLRADYITAQLGAWRYGTRTAIAPDCMQTVASSLTEAQVSAAAAWLASQDAAIVTASQQPVGTAAARLPLACGSQK